MTQVDLLGRPMTPQEAQMLAIYESLKTMAADPLLPPCAERNVKRALSAMWHIVNDLDLKYEQLYDVGI
jgi:hypothetical protein